MSGSNASAVGHLVRAHLLLCAAVRLAVAQDAPIARPSDDPSKDEAPVELKVFRDGEVPTRLYAPIEVDGARRFVLVDSGTARFWLTSPMQDGAGEWIDDAFVVTLGARRLHVLGRRVPPFTESVEGETPIGAIGNDYLIAGSLLLDLGKGTLQRLPRGTKFADAEKWPSVPFTLDRGILLVDVRFDQKPVKVILDTGAADSIWIGAGGGGSEKGDAHDVHGNALPYLRGTIALTISEATPARDVPVMRMKEFPHVEEIAKALGRQIDGLLGLSALGHRRILFDPSQGRISFEP